MVDVEDAVDRIVDMYDFREFLEIIMGYERIASDIIEIAEVYDVEEEEVISS